MGLSPVCATGAGIAEEVILPFQSFFQVSKSVLDLNERVMDQTECVLDLSERVLDQTERATLNVADLTFVSVCQCNWKKQQVNFEKT